MLHACEALGIDPARGLMVGDERGDIEAALLPDIFIDQDSPNAMYATAGLDAKGIVAKAFEALGQNLRGEAVKLGRVQ